MEIGNSKIRKLVSVPQLLLDGSVFQKWSCMSSLIGDANYRAYATQERYLIRNAPRQDRDGEDGPGQDRELLSFKSVKL